MGIYVRIFSFRKLLEASHEKHPPSRQRTTPSLWAPSNRRVSVRNLSRAPGNTHVFSWGSAGAGAGSWVCYRLPHFCSQVGCSVLSWQGVCVSTFTRTRVSANRNCRICVPIEHGKKNYFFFANSLSSHMDFNSTRNKFSPTKARFPRLVLYVTVDIASG